MSAWNIVFPIVWDLCEHLQYELVQIEWTVICRITTQKIPRCRCSLLHFYCKLFICIFCFPNTGHVIIL